MGAEQSNQSKVKTKTRKPSIHSGILYIPSLPESAASPKSHVRFSSHDFDKSASDIKENLPEDLKAYCDSIETMYRFWCQHIETLSENEFKEAAVLFYVNVFKLVPEARRLFTKNIELQAKQFFGMFRWLIVSLKQPDPSRLIKKIRTLGTLHEKMKIKPEWYELFLQAFHETMHEIAQDTYTPRVKFCMEQLYTVVMNLMLNRDFECLSSAKIAKLLKSIRKLEDCLEDNEASTYLELFMRQQFCVELMLFYKDYRKFKSCLSDASRQQIGQEIMKQYLSPNSECEINVSYEAKEEVYNTLSGNEDTFSADIFDECANQCVLLIRLNIWKKFTDSIMKMAVDADLNYEEIQKSKSTSNLQSRTQSRMAPPLALNDSTVTASKSFSVLSKSISFPSFQGYH